MIIIGGLKFSINLNEYVDSFDRVCRINLIILNGKNGTKLDIQYCNHHVYNNFHRYEIDRKKIENYKEYDYIPKECLEEYIQCVLNGEFNEVKEHYEIDKYDVSNRILEKLNCPYYFEKQPRTGYQAILYYLEEGYEISAIGFSLDEENNFAYTTPNKPLIPGTHNYRSEFKVLKWLYNNNIIGGFEENNLIIKTLEEKN